MKINSFRLTQACLILSLFSFAQISRADSSSGLASWPQSTLNEISQTDWTKVDCKAYLASLENKVSSIGTDGTALADLRAQAPTVIDNLWKIRLALHEHLAASSDDCVHEIRTASQKIRFLEDFFGEINSGVKAISPDGIAYQEQAIPFLEDSPNYLIQKRNDMPSAIQEGDVILARGTSFLSAVVSRIGEVDAEYSHVIMVVKNPDNDQLETIESYIDDGVKEHEFKWALKNENGRLLVLRAKDHDLAVKTARMMQKEVRDRGEANRIHYDYALDFSDHTTMSCAEVAVYAYDKASQGKFTLPERESRLNHGIDLLKNLNVKAGPTFTPGDMEGDSRFDMIAEFRDLRLTRDMRLRDAIMAKMISWMDTEGATLHPDVLAKMAGGPIWSARHSFMWPVVRKLLSIDDFSPEIPRPMVETVKLLNELGTGVLAKLQAEDDANFEKTGVYMNYATLEDSLEAIQKSDEITYENKKTRKNSVLAKYLRAK